MTELSTKRRNILLVSIIVVVLIASTIGAVIIYNQFTTTRINLRLSTNQTDVLQGSSVKIPIKISLTGNPENVELTSVVNSSKINCYIDPANGSSSFNSTLAVNVDDSAQGGNYSVTLKTSSPTITANASWIIMV